MNKKTTITIFVLVLLIVALGSFYYGMIYSKKTITSDGGKTMIISGYITEKSNTSFSIKTIDNNEIKIIYYSDKTPLAGSIVVGDLATINGVLNASGSITAQSIQIKSAFDIIPSN